MCLQSYVIFLKFTTLQYCKEVSFVKGFKLILTADVVEANKSVITSKTYHNINFSQKKASHFCEALWEMRD